MDLERPADEGGRPAAQEMGDTLDLAGAPPAPPAVATSHSLVDAPLEVGGNGNGRPYDPTRPYDAFKGSGIDPSTLVAPLIGPDGKPVQPPDALDRMSERIKSFFTGFLPESRPTYTPGIYRRSRERAEQRMWRRD